MDKHIEELDRQEFETWFISLFHPHHMNRNESGSYYFIDANVAWTAWQERGKALLARLEAAEQALIKPLPIGELIHRLEGQTYRKWYDDDELDKMRVRTETAEARLLVPVKLPRMHVGFDGVSTNAGDSVRNKTICDCSEAIRLAGFTVDEGQDLWLT